MLFFDFIFGLAASVRHFILIIGLIGAAVMGIDSLGDDFSSFTSRIYYGYPAADRQPSFTVGKYDEKNYNWKLFAQNKDNGVNVFYDRKSVSLDDKNGIATVLIKAQQNKEIDLYRMVLRFDKPHNEMLITDTWSNTNNLPKNYNIEKVENETVYHYLCDHIHKDLEVRKTAKSSLSIDEFVVQHSKGTTKSLPNSVVKANVFKNELCLANGKVDFLNSDGKYLSSLYVVTDQKSPIPVTKLDERIINMDKRFAVPKSNCDATLLSSTRDNIQKLTLRRGRKYSIVSNHLGRCTLKAPDANGKIVLVVTRSEQLIIPEDIRLFKISFTYKGEVHTGWTNVKNLLNVK